MMTFLFFLYFLACSKIICSSRSLRKGISRQNKVRVSPCMMVPCLTIAPFCDGMFVITDNWQASFSNLHRTKSQHGDQTFSTHSGFAEANTPGSQRYPARGPSHQRLEKCPETTREDSSDTTHFSCWTISL
jgi:hypothetical protein